MKRPLWSESRGLLPWLIVILLVFVVANLVKEGVLSAQILESRKEEIATVSDVVSILAIIIAGVLSYIRFFKGRVLRPKLVIKPLAGSISLKDEVLFWVDLEIESKGSVGIWNYTVGIYAKLHGTTETEEPIRLSDFVKLFPAEETSENLIDVGESAFEHVVFLAPKQTQAVTFQIRVTEQSDAIWERFLTIEGPKTTPIEYRRWIAGQRSR